MNNKSIRLFFQYLHLKRECYHTVPKRIYDYSVSLIESLDSRCTSNQVTLSRVLVIINHVSLVNILGKFTPEIYDQMFPSQNEDTLWN